MVLQETSRPLTAGALKLLDDAIAARPGGVGKVSRADLIRTLEAMPVEKRAHWLTKVAMAQPINIVF